ncbi:Y-family DNA polymerase [Woeseia oceani]|uniref:UmuC domain-containing protein n=1 Tax=Woeseia oceani TaxID=1548547 RepID=A0A193LFE9_9GAMM|nr:DNA polymerase Y family protein [Woeseia oceani]ANO51181.1 hypothetical protein BA177_08160 [Woeseia oceani]
MAVAGKKPALLRDADPTPAVTRAPEQQSLLPEEPPLPPPQRQPLRRTRPDEQLWLCLYLPRLPLESSNVADDLPLYAVFEERQGIRQILQASAAALAAGVHPGLSVDAALALLPGLQLEERDAVREQQLLQELAAWAERYTSFVVVEAPSLLLLELKASLRLFAGLKRLRSEIVKALEAQGYSALPAIAPTPLAATWLARAGSRRCIIASDKLTRAVSVLPLSCLAWPAKLTASLQGMGLSQVGDLLRLPRAGFSQRFGAQRLLELDRALGRLPDPRPHFRAPQPFVADCDLDGEHSDRAWLLNTCEQLLQKLERFLLTRQLASRRLHFRFYHLQHAATALTLGSARAERSSALWLQLLSIRFEQTELPAPVIAIRLQAADGQPLTATSASLGFSSGPADEVPIDHLIERLAARMGNQAVHGIDTVAEHRPDHAWRRQRLMDCVPRCAAPAPAPLLRRRPLWMLELPEALSLQHGQPCYQGPLQLEHGPERIESGWWDGASIARDYYVASSPAGSCLWIFQDRKGGGWYVHGFFG